MIVSGLFYPQLAAAFGGIWCVGRVLYGYGYSTGSPDNRQVGGIVSHLGDLPLFGLIIKTSYELMMA